MMTASLSSDGAETFLFEHPTLGSMTGIVTPDTPDVVRFRAVPYAILPGRFKQSVLRESFDELSRDFTKQGYASPHSFGMDDIHSGGLYPGQDTIEASESDCLILDVNVPKVHLRATMGKLPVMTYVHGGAFVLGKLDAQHNTAPMVQHAINLKKPVITTSVQYRLGALGFMATPDGEKNFGLKDQRNALLWIQNFIGGFGGDKSRITLFGESAGGYSICCHMLSPRSSTGPLFNRVIIMSGVMGPMLCPVSEDKAATAFARVCENLGIEETGEVALERLRAFDVQDIVSASDAWYAKGNSWSPVQDLSFFRSKIAWDNVHELLGRCEWVDNMIVGNTGFEGQACIDIANSLTPTTFYEHLKLALSGNAARKIMEAYHVTLDMDQNLFLTSAMRWFGDIVFDAPIHAFTKHITRETKKNIYRYIFDVGNPFPTAPFYQQAHHWGDVYFIFRTMQFRFPYKHLKRISDKHAELWINFANGEAPWNAFGDWHGGVIMVADERDGWAHRMMGQHEDMSGVEFARLDSLWEAWGEKKGEMWLPLDMVALKDAAP
ncbi:carboxylic ester hydrolase [Parastagonospora nodorum]|uniref:Carboxylic ester hydrolase n=2 Tax=Phaeosphaeria nodorum (strain SN15 / ATCC MYA-4574 / FGSC 10173) TaxID=321614 RepID=A0A7U2EZY7_PHANO|nr:hypothetical protein SNOG_01150 [Parastagonospora nodorum SN15]KAH3908545.1 carboxylic ester hydrolase [Parastagonospora nodorum]EAT90799.2 hypothetical protein SNOG_01150 [Parastagonospora nodorum SN15]KAH3926304.1 carboxylic ester hydrolase [Parastagonospora nodorum]KAH3965549.1 carboxylic ester hydrolase [Parastagonospora nodorum]KAH3971369.1 carboxylic ester hydrolase [Parastagonospora nodorum]